MTGRPAADPAAPTDPAGPAEGPHARTHARLVRRGTHASRSVPTVVVALLLAAAALWTGTEAALEAFARPALLVAPGDVLGGLAAAADDSPTVVVAAGVVTALLGVVLLVLAVAPGRRGRHELVVDDHVSAVVDDRVVAAAAARTARAVGGLAPSQVTAWVSRRRLGLDLTPTSGVALDDDAVRDAVRDELVDAGLRPPLEVTARVSRTGRIGA